MGQGPPLDFGETFPGRQAPCLANVLPTEWLPGALRSSIGQTCERLTVRGFGYTRATQAGKMKKPTPESWLKSLNTLVPTI